MGASTFSNAFPFVPYDFSMLENVLVDDIVLSMAEGLSNSEVELVIATGEPVEISVQNGQAKGKQLKLIKWLPYQLKILFSYLSIPQQLHSNF